MEQDKFQEIIKELAIAMGKLKQTALQDILKKYKAAKPEDTSDLILSWNTTFKDYDDSEFNDELEETGGKKGKKKKEQPNFFYTSWIKIGNHTFPLYLLFTIETCQIYDIKKEADVYIILINKGVETKNSIVKDVCIYFPSKEERDKEYEKIHSKLEPFGIKFI